MLLRHARAPLSHLKAGHIRRAHSKGAPKSPHASFYSEMVPGMIPVAILGSAVFLGLQLWQGRLSHEKYLDEARARVAALEAEVDALQRAQNASTVGSTSAPTQAKSQRWTLW